MVDPSGGAAGFPGCAAGTDVRSACSGLVDDLDLLGDLPSVYLLVDGRLRCQASRGYFQVSDGFAPTAGVIGQVVTSGMPVVISDVAGDPSFFAAVPGLRAEACFPVRVDGHVVGAVNLESRGELGAVSVEHVRRAAGVLGRRLEALGGLPRGSLAERVARVAVSLGSQTDVGRVHALAVAGALDLAGTLGAAVVSLDADLWSVACTAGPLGEVLQGWDHDVWQFLSRWVQAGTSSYFPDGEDVPPGYAFLGDAVSTLSVHPMLVAGRVTGLLVTADSQAAPHDPALTATLELLAAQTGATVAMARTLVDLEHRARHDQLTGLVNRRGLLDALQVEVDRTDGQPYASLVLLDLDGFKAVNDQFGHSAGDVGLCAVARELERCARASDVVCRLGGDEFAVLVHADSPEAALAVGTRMVAAVGRTAQLAGQLPVQASAGVRLGAPTSTSGLLLDADVALYAAKRAGPGSVVLWDPALRDAGLELDSLVHDLLTALAEGALTLAYQPVVDIHSLRVRGIEALARWSHPDRGQVPPSLFVACAERAGKVAELTRWVLRTAFQDAASWPDADDGGGIKIAVNISAAQLADERIVADVRNALRASGLRADRVVLEVTETAQVVDLDRAKQTLEALADLGVGLALDDFGTGYSSLSHVQALPFDILKIDRSFVAAAAGGDRRGLATIAAVCALAERLGVDVVAEGVEDQRQLAELADLGCGYAQGYALARPMTGEHVRAALATQPRQGWVLASRSAPPVRLVRPA